MSYTKTIQIEFNHCDPAGIVFYPRYFEMTNSVVENFFADEIGRSFAQMHNDGMKNGVPTVHIEADFVAPSRLGDKVDFTLVVRKLGGSSVTVEITGRMGDEVRMRARITLVWIDNMKAARWPEAMRARLAAHLEEAA
ncbi:MAG: acyl-CoA thioesterase [Alphaproteobacteria bacterium]|jgi:4-hydroxybenzoyl-CoA thioesterase|nr:acyl-CoA thioesterase [Alphaproteobacteria bacterium]